MAQDVVVVVVAVAAFFFLFSLNHTTRAYRMEPFGMLKTYPRLGDKQ